jgi:cytidine deaminase
MSDLAAMIEAARAARANAYVPYSKFAVGACIRGGSGRLHSGCNVENAAFPQGLCAESVAIGAMVAAGESRILEVLLMADGEPLCTPCGGCRQRLGEFAGPDVPVHLCDLSGLRRTLSFGELLPFPFTAAGLGS